MDREQWRHAFALVPGDFIAGADVIRVLAHVQGLRVRALDGFTRTTDGRWLSLLPAPGPTYREWDCGDGVTARSSREPLLPAAPDVAAELEAFDQLAAQVWQSAEQLRPCRLQDGRYVPVPRQHWLSTYPLDAEVHYPRANVEAFASVLERPDTEGTVPSRALTRRQYRRDLFERLRSVALAKLNKEPCHTYADFRGWCSAWCKGEDNPPVKSSVSYYARRIMMEWSATTTGAAAIAEWPDRPAWIRS
jgi:hypothetical protein